MSGTGDHVPKGYKQTEIGVFPEEWELKTFGEIFDFKSTASNSRSDLTESDSTHYIHYGDIHTVFHRHLNLEKSDTPMISRERCKNAALVKNGDWVMADASEDHSGICKAIEVSGITQEDSVVAGLHTFLLRDRAGAYVPGFKGHLGEAKYLYDQYVRVSVGLKVFGVTKTSLRDLLIPVPPKPEQAKIEQVLTDSDYQIQALQDLISKKRRIKQGTMQELLTGKTRLTGISGEWESIRLGELAFIERGKLITKNQSVHGEVPVIAGGMEPAYFHNVSNRNGKTITISGSGANAGYVSFHKIPIFASDCSTINESSKYSIEFIFFMLQNMQHQIYAEQTGGAQPHIHPSNLNPMQIYIPSEITEQEAIAEVLSDMDAEIVALEQRLEKTKAIKQGIVQELLTGKTRMLVPDST